MGASVVNALSTETVVEVARDRRLYTQGYSRGVPAGKLHLLRNAPGYDADPARRDALMAAVIAPLATRLTVFQRSPQWIAPNDDYFAPVGDGMAFAGPAFTVEVRPGDNLMFHVALADWSKPEKLHMWTPTQSAPSLIARRISASTLVNSVYTTSAPCSLQSWRKMVSVTPAIGASSTTGRGAAK